MPIVSDFKTCNHMPPGAELTDWRECFACIDELAMQVRIARTYLRELAEAKFNDNGDCVSPVSEPLQGRHFQQIASTGLGAIS